MEVPYEYAHLSKLKQKLFLIDSLCVPMQWYQLFHINVELCPQNTPQQNILQVLVKEPLPAEAKKSGDSFEDTMLLLDIVREKKKKQNENKKVLQKSF